MYSQIKNVIEEIKKAENIVLAGHVSPDGDAVSANFALALAIKKLGKEPIILLEKYSDTYNYLKGHNLVYTGEQNKLNPELFISLDCGDISRLGGVEEVFKRAKKTINIDHHMSNNNFGNINVVNKEGSSTSEVVFEIIKEMEEAFGKDFIDKDIATIIYTGIVFDTCGFKHKSTGKRTHQIAGELIEKGVDSSMVHTNIIYTHTLGNTRLLAKAVENMQIDENILISTLSKEDILKKCNASFEELEGISGYLLDIKGIDVSAFLYEKRDGSIKVSFRAKELDVNEIADKFGGGGHKLASGATIKATLEEAK
ncbi:MAG: bifunctional oligoribonuclease/PAP phosphatase NrnA, partial [Eubacteriales bacterium]|nr:bifunctional oligoribonuclease/PAP phosphatase NrnA [Eubacteriales bacterium]